MGSHGSTLEDVAIPPSLCEKEDQFGNRERLFDVVQHPQLAFLFQEYLRSILSLENLLFFLEVEDFKNETSEGEMIKKAHYIFEKFLSNDAANEVDIDGDAKEFIKENLSRPTPKLFERGQQTVLLTLEGDCLPKFLQWGLFKDFVQNKKTRKVFFKQLIKNSPESNIVTRYIELHKKEREIRR